MTMPPNNPQQPEWPPPGDGYPGQPMQPTQQPRNGLGITALVLGIVGLLFAVIPITFWLGAILGVLGLIFGIIGLSRARKGEATNKGMALTGLILSAVSIVVAIVWVIVLAVAVNEVAKDIKEEVKKQETATAAPSAGATDGTGSDGPDGSTDPAAEDPAAWGDAFEYEDGVEVTVDKPVSYKPDEFAIGHEDGNVAIRLKITIVNNSKAAVDIGTALPTVKDANGAEVEGIFDGKEGTKPFTGKVLPGKQAVAYFAYSVPADATKELQLEISPSVIEYDDAIWVGPAK